MNDLFLKACRGESTERVPVWLMRQAGRYLPEYRRIREKAEFLTLCKTPELAAQVTLQPIDILGVDAAILFADILLPLEAMGAELSFSAGDGPVFTHPIRHRDQISSLNTPDVNQSLEFVFETIRLLRRELDGRLPLIGFGGSPWTLAAYLVQGRGSRHFEHLLAWTQEDPEGLSQLLERLAVTSTEYLTAQIEAGAQAIQIFDTWAGLLDAERWRRLALPPLQQVLEGLGNRVPLIYYGNNTSHLLPVLKELSVDVLSVDWRVPLGEVRRQVGDRFALQGNLDPTTLLASPSVIEAAVDAMMTELGGKRHIANLGHGILPAVPVESAKAFVRAVQKYSVPA